MLDMTNESPKVDFSSVSKEGMLGKHDDVDEPQRTKVGTKLYHRRILHTLPPSHS